MLAHGKRREQPYRVRWTAVPGAGVVVATKASPFRAPLLGGGEIDVGTIIGQRALVLTFWASWCDPCVAEAPHLVELSAKYKSRGVELVSVSIDDADDQDALRKVVAKLGITYPVALDPSGTKILPTFATGVGVPLTLLVDANGTIVFSQRNYKPGDENALQRAIDGLLGAAP